MEHNSTDQPGEQPPQGHRQVVSELQELIKEQNATIRSKDGTIKQQSEHLNEKAEAIQDLRDRLIIQIEQNTELLNILRNMEKRIRRQLYVAVVCLVTTAGVISASIWSQKKQEAVREKLIDVYIQATHDYVANKYADTIARSAELVSSATDKVLESRFPLSHCGIVLDENNPLVIQEVPVGFPADNVGIQQGDILVDIDDIAVTDLPRGKILEALRGDGPHSNVSITVLREKQRMTFFVYRKQIVPLGYRTIEE